MRAYKFLAPHPVGPPTGGDVVALDATTLNLAGGHYLSEDGGQTFRASNTGVGAGFAPDPYPEFGQCVHKIAGHKDAPGRLYMQNHGGWADWTGPGGPRPDIGVLRSDDHGKTWRSIAKGTSTAESRRPSGCRSTCACDREFDHLIV